MTSGSNSLQKSSIRSPASFPKTSFPFLGRVAREGSNLPTPANVVVDEVPTQKQRLWVSCDPGELSIIPKYSPTALNLIDQLGIDTSILEKLERTAVRSRWLPDPTQPKITRIKTYGLPSVNLRSVSLAEITQHQNSLLSAKYKHRLPPRVCLQCNNPVNHRKFSPPTISGIHTSFRQALQMECTSNLTTGESGLGQRAIGNAAYKHQQIHTQLPAHSFAHTYLYRPSIISSQICFTCFKTLSNRR